MKLTDFILNIKFKTKNMFVYIHLVGSNPSCTSTLYIFQFAFYPLKNKSHQILYKINSLYKSNLFLYKPMCAIITILVLLYTNFPSSILYYCISLIFCSKGTYSPLTIAYFRSKIYRKLYGPIYLPKPEEDYT